MASQSSDSGGSKRGYGASKPRPGGRVRPRKSPKQKDSGLSDLRSGLSNERRKKRIGEGAAETYKKRVGAVSAEKKNPIKPKTKKPVKMPEAWRYTPHNYRT